MDLIWTEPEEDARVDLLIDRPSLARGPMVRGDGPPYVLLEGQRVTRQSEQRRGFCSVLGADGHLARFDARHPERQAVAVTGCGNLGMNAGVRAWLDGRWFGVDGPAGGALTVNAAGAGVRADPDTDPEDGWLISGPDLVRAGRVSVSDATLFADPRHLLGFPYVTLGSGERVDLGHDTLLADPHLYRQAVAGTPVTLRMPEDLSTDELRRALSVKDYVESADLTRRGSYRLDHRDLTLTFQQGVYPHHALGVDSAGRVGSLLVPGQSNRTGTTIAALAETLVDHGFHDAILLDNGGDVGLWLPQQARWNIQPAEPDREEAWPLTACLVYSTKRAGSPAGSDARTG